MSRSSLSLFLSILLLSLTPPKSRKTRALASHKIETGAIAVNVFGEIIITIQKVTCRTVEPDPRACFAISPFPLFEKRNKRKENKTEDINDLMFAKVVRQSRRCWVSGPALCR